MESRYLRIFELAKPLLATRDNELHTRVAYSFALKLLAAEGGDEYVVLPAVILHDIGWKSIPEEDHLKAVFKRPSDNGVEHDFPLYAPGANSQQPAPMFSFMISVFSRKLPLAKLTPAALEGFSLWRTL